MNSKSYQLINRTTKIYMWRIVLGAVFTVTAFILLFVYSINIYISKADQERRSSLKQMVLLAHNSILPIVASIRDGKLSQKNGLAQIRSQVRHMTYKDEYGDNYVFMSSYDGKMLVQPFEPAREGSNQWNLKDTNGKYIIQSLIRTARSNPEGGFTSYHYYPPNSGKPEEKLSFVMPIPELNCYIGTGAYLSSYNIARIRLFRNTMLICLLFVILVFATTIISIKNISRNNRQLLYEIDERKKAEEALRSAEEYYREIFENAAVAIFRSSKEGSLLYTNQAFADMLGYDDPEQTKQAMTDLAHSLYLNPENREAIVQRIMQCTGYVSVENVFRRRDGSTFIASMYIKSIRDENGDITHFDGFIEDVTERRMIEAALRESEAKFRQLFEMSQDGMVKCGIDGSFQEWNASYERMIGYSADEMKSMTFWDITPEEWHNKEKDLLCLDLNEETTKVEYEKEYRRKDGVIFPVEISRFIVRDNNNKPLYTWAVIRDTTERKKYEHELLQSQARLNSIFENIPIELWAMDVNGKYILQSPMSIERWGNLVGMTINDSEFSEEIKSQFTSNILKIMEGQFLNIETEYIINGEKRYMHEVLAPIKIGDRIDGIVGLSTDITDQRKASTMLISLNEELEQRVQQRKVELETAYETLRENERLLRTVLDALPVAVLISDKRGIVQSANRAGLRILGEKEFRSRDCYYARKAWWPKTGKPIEADEWALRKVINGHQEILDEMINIESFDGKYKTILNSVVPIMDDNNEINGAVVVNQDITDRVADERKIIELNENLRKRAQELEEANKALNDSLKTLRETQDYLIQSEKTAALSGLVAGIAHEINTPLGIGVTAASFLEQKTKFFQEEYNKGSISKNSFEKYLSIAVESSTMILSNLKRAGDLVESFKQVAVDQTSEKRRRFDLRKYLEEVMLSLRPKLKRTSHEIILECPEQLELDSYPGAYSQIITNLVMNSLTHAFEGITAGQITISVTDNGDSITMVFSDNGKGMSKEIRKKVFEPFFTTRRGQGGSGLGLHVVYNLVNQTLGGKIECFSEINIGTRFVITVPRTGKA